jgi:hypothetical protein
VAACEAMRTVVRLFMVAPALMLLGGCSLGSGLDRAVRSLARANPPVALATFDEDRLPIAPGAHGTMVGYIPTAGPHNPRDATFTYLINFDVVSSRELGREIEGRGVRRIFFSPDGARASFGDPLTFAHGREVQTDKVKLSGEWRPEKSHMRLRLWIYDSQSRRAVPGSGIVRVPANEPLIFLGRYRENVGGWMFSPSSTSF